MTILPTHQKWCKECGWKGQPQIPEIHDWDDLQICQNCGSIEVYWTKWKPERGEVCPKCNTINPSPDGKDWICPKCIDKMRASKERGTPLGYIPKADHYDPSNGY